MCKGSPSEDKSFGCMFLRSFISLVHERGLMNAFISKITIWRMDIRFTRLNSEAKNGRRNGRTQKRDGHADIDDNDYYCLYIYWINTRRVQHCERPVMINEERHIMKEQYSLYVSNGKVS